MKNIWEVRWNYIHSRYEYFNQKYFFYCINLEKKLSFISMFLILFQFISVLTFMGICYHFKIPSVYSIFPICFFIIVGNDMGIFLRNRFCYNEITQAGLFRSLDILTELSQFNQWDLNEESYGHMNNLIRELFYLSSCMKK